MFIRTKNATYFQIRFQPFLHADGDPVSAGGGGTGDGGAGNSPGSVATPATPTPPAANLADWTAALDRLGDNITREVGGRLDQIRELGAQEPAQLADPVDLESLSRPELVAHITTSVLDAFKAHLSEALSPLQNQVQSLQTDYTTRNSMAEINDLRGKHKDFADWKDDMIGLTKLPQYAALGITDLYQLARAKNPTKANELDTKYSPPPARPTRPSFGGLLPTGSGAGGNGAKPLSPREAGMEAYREVQARHSDVLPALESL